MRRHRPAATALSLLGTVALAAALAACTDPGEESSPSSAGTTTAGEPADDTTTSGGAGEEPTDQDTDEATDDPSGDGATGADGVASAAVGTCLNLADLLAAEGGVTDLPPVECTEEHDAQVFAVVTMPDGEFPGDDDVLAAVDECASEFEGFVGTPPGDSELEFDGIGPSEDTWAVGDREIICLVFYPDLSPTSESFEGSEL